MLSNSEIAVYDLLDTRYGESQSLKPDVVVEGAMVVSDYGDVFLRPSADFCPTDPKWEDVPRMFYSRITLFCPHVRPLPDMYEIGAINARFSRFVVPDSSSPIEVRIGAYAVHTSLEMSELSIGRGNSLILETPILKGRSVQEGTYKVTIGETDLASLDRLYIDPNNGGSETTTFTFHITCDGVLYEFEINVDSVDTTTTLPDLSHLISVAEPIHRAIRERESVKKGRYSEVEVSVAQQIIDATVSVDTLGNFTLDYGIFKNFLRDTTLEDTSDLRSLLVNINSQAFVSNVISHASFERLVASIANSNSETGETHYKINIEYTPDLVALLHPAVTAIITERLLSGDLDDIAAPAVKREFITRILYDRNHSLYIQPSSENAELRMYLAQLADAIRVKY